MRLINLLSKRSIAVLFAALCLYGQQSVILRTAPGLAAGVNSDYALTVSRTLDSQGCVQLVSFPDTVSASAFLQTASLDARIVSAENEQPTQVPESDHSSAVATPATSGNIDALGTVSTTPISYYGNTVWEGYAQQPMTELTELPAALARFGPGGGLVAIIDTGVDSDHPALEGIFVQGYDFLNDQPGLPTDLTDLSQSTAALLNQIPQAASSSLPVSFDLNQSTVALLDQSTVALLDQSTVALLDSNSLPAAFGHGTMVSGLIHLVDPAAQIMPLRAFHADGSGNLSDIVRAIYYATDHGAQVINMSFSSPVFSPALTAAINYASSHNVVSVASAGNQGREMAVFPASLRGVIGVASTNHADIRSIFSNYGEGSARIAAPGEALITPYPGVGYAGVWGTSFSSALVSGAAALALSDFPAIDNGDILLGLRAGVPVPGQGIGGVRLDVLSLLRSY